MSAGDIIHPMTGPFRKNKRFISLLIVPAVVMLSAFTLSCSTDSYSGKMETLTIATVPTELNALVYIAEDQNFFTRNGLEVSLKEDYASGAAAATGMLNAEADIALAAEFPIVRQVFSKKDIISFGAIVRYENTFIIWRTDSGIKTIADLKGKRIGVTLQTISEFYLGRTLELNGMNIRQATLVNTNAAEAEKVLGDKALDAVVTWEPWVTQINQRMGEEVIIMPVQSGQYAYWNLVSSTGWKNNHSNTIERIMKSLAQAEEYLVQPSEMKRKLS